MYIMIVGGGSVGYYLSQALLKEGHEVLVLEKDAAKCSRLEDAMGSVCVIGDGCEVSTLAEAGAGRADVFIAATDEDEDNLVACQVAKYKFKVPRTIARISNPKNEDLFKKLGIDCGIVVTNLILKNIEEEIPTHPLVHLATMAEEGAGIVEIKIEKGSKVIGKSIRDVSLPKSSILALLMRKGEKPVVPTPDIIIKVNDRFIALTSLENEEELRRALIN
jgi:trk system potassium uptake protein TrkA